MNRRAYLDTIALFVVTILFAFFLTACGRSTDLSTPPDPETELAVCRAAMEELQSHDSIQFSIRRDFSSALNGFTMIDFWRRGEDWFETAQADGDTILHATMYCSGQYFDNFQNFIESRDYDIKWNRASPIPDETPWLYVFRWENQEVTHVSTGYTADGRVVKARFDSPYIFFNTYVSQGYQAEFHFDKKENLDKVVLSVTGVREDAVRDNNGKTGEYREVKDSWVDTITVLSTDDKKIGQRIDKEYEHALNQCTVSPEDQEALDKCRAVMEELQSHDSYHISIEVEDADTNFVKEILRNGDDWMFITDNRGKSGEAFGDVGFLSRGGEKFKTQAVGMKQDKNDFQWGAVEVLPERMEKYVPWLYSCKWDEQEVTLVDQSFGPGGGAIFVMFKTPYVYPDSNFPVTENYVVQFTFDSEQNLRYALMRAFYRYEKPEEQDNNFVKAESFTILSTDEAEIAARIDQEYQRALSQNP